MRTGGRAARRRAGKVKIHHLLVTRFNLRPHFARHSWEGDRPLQHLDPSWIEGRMRIFESVTAPCVRAQSEDDFDWFMLIDPGTPEAIRARLRANHPRLQTIEVGGTSLSTSGAQKVTRRLACDAFDTHRPDLLLQSRIDTDDGIASDYFAQLRAAVLPGQTEFLTFRHGFQLDSMHKHAFHHTWPSNSLMNLAQPRSAHPIGIHDAWHTRVKRVAPLRELTSGRMWLQVIHGSNASSQLGNGLPVSPSTILDRFAIDPALVRSRTSHDLVLDAIRWLRGAFRPELLVRGLAGKLPRWALVELRRRRRAERLRPVVETLRASATHDYTVEGMEALLDAWGEGERLPSAAYLLEVARALHDRESIVECGVGPTTLLLYLLAPERCMSYEPDPIRRADLQHLLAAIGCEASSDRVLDARDLAATPSDADLLLANSHPGPRPIDGYDLLPQAARRLAYRGSVLFDDARRATSVDGPEAGFGEPAMIFALPKPFARSDRS
jgi:hypothetical protein